MVLYNDASCRFLFLVFFSVCMVVVLVGYFFVSDTNPPTG